MAFTTDGTFDGEEAPDATEVAKTTAAAIDSNPAAMSAKKPMIPMAKRRI